MLIEVCQREVQYTRISKNGLEHNYTRYQRVAILKCDSCNNVFERPTKNMDYRRLTPEHTHVCPNCNQKRFAQKKGAESRKFWNTTVDLDIDITSI